MDEKQRNHTTPDIKKESLYMNQTGNLRIRLTNDYLFKALLQKNSLVLQALIRDLLHLPKNAIENLEVTNPIIFGESADDKTIVLDVNVVLNSGSRVNLEMQVLDEGNWRNRSTFYACRNFAELNRGEDYEELKPVFQISFLKFTLFKEHAALYSTYKLMECEKHYVYNENLMIGVVDLTKTELATKEDEAYHINEWAKLFKAETWEDVKMLAAENTSIAEAAQTIYELSEDERIRQQCQAREDYYKRQSGLTKRIARQEEKLAEIEEELSQKKEELSQKKEELLQKKEELSQKNEELSQKKEELSQKDRIIDQRREEFIQLLLNKGFVESREEAVLMVDGVTPSDEN
ncbi:MAG: Rpn family recombination-promoting nuclease/putative transposase [Lachnospiraceae bacterium]|nr:Rpn family recombination-promoting nuclease/putative transposase [Lachnospiraceae bacterium]